MGGRANLSYVKGIHNIKAGIVYEDTILTEQDTFGIVDPTFNPVCFNADGSPHTDPTLTNPNNCTGMLQPNPAYNPLLACIDLTRTAPIPASNGCPGSTSGLYTYHGHADIRELALFFQDNITVKNWSFNLGVRFDHYDGITGANQAEPRLGIAYNHQAEQYRISDFLCAHARNALQREPGAGEHRLQ